MVKILETNWVPGVGFFSFLPFFLSPSLYSLLSFSKFYSFIYYSGLHVGYSTATVLRLLIIAAAVAADHGA